jgi:hypothetical protein
MATKKITLNELRSIVKQIIKEESESTVNKINNEKIKNFITKFLDLNEKNLKFIIKLYKELTNEEKYVIMRIFGGEDFKDDKQIYKANNLYHTYYPSTTLDDANEIERFYWVVAHANERKIYDGFDGQKIWDEYRSVN